MLLLLFLQFLEKKNRLVFSLCSVLVSPFPFFSLFLPPAQSASHIAASPKVSAKVKKDNVKYAAWATSQINRAYKVRDTVISSPSFSPVSTSLENCALLQNVFFPHPSPDNENHPLLSYNSC